MRLSGSSIKSRKGMQRHPPDGFDGSTADHCGPPASGWPPAEAGRGAPVGSARGGHGETGAPAALAARGPMPSFRCGFRVSHEAAEAKLQQEEAEERKKRKQQVERAHLPTWSSSVADTYSRSLKYRM